MKTETQIQLEKDFTDKDYTSKFFKSKQQFTYFDMIDFGLSCKLITLEDVKV